MGWGRWSGRSRRGVDNCDGIVVVARVLNIGVVRGVERLRVVLLVLFIRFLLLVEFALVLLVFCYAGLQATG